MAEHVNSPEAPMGVNASFGPENVHDVAASATPVAPLPLMPQVAPDARATVVAEMATQADVGARQIPAHLVDEDALFNENEMRLLHKNDCVGIINRL